MNNLTVKALKGNDHVSISFSRKEYDNLRSQRLRILLLS